ncbi:Uncharacterised protein [Fusobacterium necrogenes]|uniref:Uncharacterized protein n=1 Tax=Fusobacterium necrogenes TaxID=858 RepID=A0A377GX21_9FUSO|nr:hypothetical protein [Fusobacterium necrogenes]STO31540.1 Uncharacterised protein [Fusobacterium necrogenes]
MKVELRKWNKKYKYELKDICNKIDRKYLSNRIPNPYKAEDVIWWLDYLDYVEKMKEAMESSELLLLMEKFVKQ